MRPALPLLILALSLPVLAEQTPADALAELQTGNARYVSGHLKHPHQDVKRRAELASGQHPPVVVVACADSRVAPELVFDEGLGDIFVIREAGNSPDVNGVASVEYAVEHLGTRTVVIMGHTSCGALTATLHTPVGTSAGSKSLDALVDTLRGNLSSLTEEERHEKGLRTAARVNATAAARSMVEASPVLAALVKKGELKVLPAVYDLDSGEVTFEKPLSPDSVKQSDCCLAQHHP